MNVFRNLPVARKFFCAFGVLVALCALLGAIALAGLSRINRSTANLAEVALPSAQAVADMQSAMQIDRRADMGLVLCDNSDCITDRIGRRKSAMVKFRDAYSRYVATPVDPAQRKLVESASAQFEKYQQASDATVALYQSGHKDQAASQIVGANAQLFRQPEALMTGAVDANTKSSRDLCLRAVAVYKSVRLMLMLVIAFTLLLSEEIGRLLTRSIAPPLLRATQVLEAVAERDLTQTVPAEGRDEIGRMANALNTAVTTMRGLLHSMQHGVETVSSAASELSSRSAISADDAQRQSAETNQIATATQQMASTVSEVSLNAERASQASRDAAESANSGGAVILKMTDRMQCISGSNQQTVTKMVSLVDRSQQIGKVVTTIREISDQTNLLALNAAIEAQRAGEHGRGFAVVAGEVRRLAERTKNATEEIDGTITTIQAETREVLNLMEAGKCGIAEGLVESEKARMTLESIIGSCRSSEEQIVMIATAETQQAAVSQEISKSLSNISQVSTSLSAAARETTQASEELSKLASELNREINRFRLTDDPASSPAASRLQQKSSASPSGSALRSGGSRASLPITAALILCGTLIFGASRAAAQQLATVSPLPAATDRPAASSPSQIEQIKQDLDQARMLLREQEDAIRFLRVELDKQKAEIESLHHNANTALSAGAAAAPAPPSENADAARLHAAVSSSLAPPPVVKHLRAAQENTPPLPTSELYFRIGNATFTPSGWVDFTAFYRTADVGSGLGTSFQSIPYNNTVQGGESELRFTAQSSRIGMRVDESIGKVKAYGYLEADFNGYLPGNAYVTTNSNTLRMRVYYLNIARGKWEILGGQGWSLLTPTRKALSPFLADLFTTFHLDTSYQAGLIYARQTQFRFVYHPLKTVAMGLSVENPQQYSGSAVTFPTLFSNTETDINSSSGSGGATATPNLYPDVIAKTTWDRTLHGLYWHMGAAGLLTTTRVFTPASVTKTVSVTDDRAGGAVAGNIFLELFKGFHLLCFGYWSDGGGRYLGGTGPGFVVLQSGKVTAPFTTTLIHSGSGIGGFEWTLNKRNTISAYGSGFYFQRRYGLDPDIKTATYAGYGFPGSANTNNRTIRELSFATTTTLWQSPERGALQAITQSSYVTRAPWYVAAGTPKDAHTMMEFVNLRYVFP